MPFSGKPIDPHHIELMRSAFNRVCERLDLKSKPERRDLAFDAIVEITGNGERNLDRLCELVEAKL